MREAIKASKSINNSRQFNNQRTSLANGSNEAGTSAANMHLNNNLNEKNIEEFRQKHQKDGNWYIEVRRGKELIDTFSEIQNFSSSNDCFKELKVTYTNEVSIYLIDF
jgi:hypothetical protein